MNHAGERIQCGRCGMSFIVYEPQARVEHMRCAEPGCKLPFFGAGAGFLNTRDVVVAGIRPCDVEEWGETLPPDWRKIDGERAYLAACEAVRNRPPPVRKGRP